MAKSGVLQARDLVVVNKTFEGYVKPFQQRRTIFFTILLSDVKHKSKINRNLLRFCAIYTNLTATKRFEGSQVVMATDGSSYCKYNSLALFIKRLLPRPEKLAEN